MALGDITSVEISPSGAEPFGACADITIDGFTTGKSVDFGSGYGNQLDFADIASATIVFTVVSEGYNSSGSLGTVTRTLYGTSVVRKPYPNEADDQEPAATSIRIALSDFVYDDDNTGAGKSGTAPTVTIAAAAIRNDGGASETSNVATNLTCTNSSTLDYPQTIARWDRVAGVCTADRVTAAFTMACRAYNRNGIACVRFDATGQTSAHNENSTATSRTATQRVATNLYAEAYHSASTPLTSFTDDELIDLRFRAYPIVGDADSIRDSNNHTTSTEECLGYNKATVVCDKDNDSTLYAVVSTSGNDTTGANSSVLATAEGTPYLTITEAIKDGANLIYLLDGTHAAVSAAITRRTTNEWVVVTHHPTSSSKAGAIVQVVSAVKTYRCQRLQFKDVTFDLASTSSWIDGEDAGNFLRLTGVTFDEDAVGAPTTGIGYRSHATYLENCDGDMGEQEWNWDIFSTVKMNYLFDGCDFGTPGTPGTKSMSCYELVACFQSGVDGKFLGTNTGGPVKDHVEISFNHILDYGLTSSPFFDFFAGTSGDDIAMGVAIVGNVIEKTGATSALAAVAGDSTACDANNVIVWHNTFAGERGNWGYNETGSTIRVRRNWSQKYNSFRDWNNKDDTFGTPNAARVGGWPVAYGVGFQSNHHEISTFPGEYGGLDLTTGSPGYVDDNSLTGSGTGNGDYTPDTGSALLQRIPSGQRVVTIDLFGNPVVNGGDIGAVQVTSLVSGSGALTAPAGSVSGSGVVGKTGTGALAAPAGSVSGSGDVGPTVSGTTGWRSFQSAATSSDSALFPDWPTPSNALVEDGTVTTVVLDEIVATESEYLKLTNINYGTTIPSVAGSYTVSFRFKRAFELGGGREIRDKAIFFIDNASAIVGNNMADLITQWPGSLTLSGIYTGGNSEWGITFSGSKFNSLTGIAIKADGQYTNGSTDVEIDFAEIKIDWEGEPSGSGALTAPAGVIFGAGTVTHSGGGALAAPAGVVSGAGISGRVGSGALTAPPGAVSGAGVTGVTGSGALVAPAGVMSGSGYDSLAEGTGALVAPAGVISGSGYSFTAETPGVDYITWYLTGASAEGASQRDQALSLGGFRSGVELRSMTWDCRDPMVGIEILGVSGLNGRGTGSLAAVTENSLSWTPPLGTAGDAVEIAYGEEKRIAGFGDSGWILVRRNSTLPLAGAHGVTCVDIFNNLIGFDNVPSADAVAGETYYRSIIGHNSFGGPITSLALWLGEDVTNLAIGYEEVVAGEIQTIADETTAPTGITWVTGTTAGTGLILPPIAADGLFGIWFRRTIPADTDPSPSVLNKVHVQFSDVIDMKYDELRGRYRIARSDYVTYGLWLGQDAEPDLSAAADEEFTSLPHTTSLAYDPDHIYYAVIRRRNKWGLWSQNTTSTPLPMDASGDPGYVPPSGPTLVTVSQNGSNEAIIGARYEPAPDGDNRGEIFVLWMTADDSEPGPADPPTGYGVMASALVSSSGTERRAAIETFKFTDTGNALLDGTPVKALVRVRRLAIDAGDAFSPDTTQLPGSGAGTIVVASELAGWPSTGYMKILKPSGALQEVVEYSNLVVGSGISTFTVLSGGRAQFGTTATATTTANVIYPVSVVDSLNATATEGLIDGLEPGRPWGDLLFGDQAAQEQDPVAGPDGVTEEWIDQPDNIYLLLGEGWMEIWIDTVLVWKVFQDGNAYDRNAVYIPDAWEIVTGAVSGAGTGVFEATTATDLYIVAGGIRRVHIDASAMTITMPEFAVSPTLPEVAPQEAAWEQFAGSLLQSWDPARSDYRPYMQLTAAGVLTSQWNIETSLSEAEILAL